MESALWERLRTIGHSARPGTHYPSRMTLRRPDVRYPQLGYAFSSKRAMSRRRTPAWSRRLEPAYYRSERVQRGMSAEERECFRPRGAFLHSRLGKRAAKEMQVLLPPTTGLERFRSVSRLCWLRTGKLSPACELKRTRCLRHSLPAPSLRLHASPPPVGLSILLCGCSIVCCELISCAS